MSVVTIAACLNLFSLLCKSACFEDKHPVKTIILEYSADLDTALCGTVEYASLQNDALNSSLLHILHPNYPAIHTANGGAQHTALIQSLTLSCSICVFFLVCTFKFFCLLTVSHS
jgi:hypothetical protein